MGKTIAIETFALEQFDDCKKNEPYIKKRLSLNGHQRWPHECPRQLIKKLIKGLLRRVILK